MRRLGLAPVCGRRLRMVCICCPPSAASIRAPRPPRAPGQPLENTAADVGVRHLAAPEEDRRLDLVAFFDEPVNMVLLELVIVLVDLRSELDFLDLDDVLMLLRFPGALLLLVLILAEVHDPADRRHGRRRDLDQVEPLLLGDGQRLRRRHDAELLAGIVDDTDFADTNAFVDARAIVAAGTSVESDNGLLAALRELSAMGGQRSARRRPQTFPWSRFRPAPGR